MARPLRIEIAGGRYPVMACGNERRDIFRKESDYLHFLEFLEFLEELPARFGTSLHAYALMKNHYLGQRRGGMSLVELGERAGGMNYAAGREERFSDDTTDPLVERLGPAVEIREVNFIRALSDHHGFAFQISGDFHWFQAYVQWFGFPCGPDWKR